jgi:hypothetical protein
MSIVPPVVPPNPVPNPLAGWKTYIAAAGILLYGGFEIWTGNPTAGAAAIIAALGLFGVRQAIAAMEEKVLQFIIDTIKGQVTPPVASAMGNASRTVQGPH